jgi:hypothetical protein
MDCIQEPARQIPVIHECDICIIGASCTGVFAAVRAARLGASVALIENNAFFGGVATAGLVNIWHSLHDLPGEKQIIHGLTWEVLQRLARRGAARFTRPGERNYAFFNSAELILLLDELVAEYPVIRPFLHTRFVDAVVEEGRVTAVIVEDKNGRRAVRARVFIDASGDGDLLVRAGMAHSRSDELQPATVCALISGLDEVENRDPSFTLAAAVHDPRHPNALRAGFLWYAPVEGVPGVRMVAGSRLHHLDCSDADQLTQAELEGRRQVRAILDIVRQHHPGGDRVALVALPAYLGIRETRHAVCHHRLTEAELLAGTQFEDAIANSTYPVDIHYSNQAGTLLRYLDGTETLNIPGQPVQCRHWRPAETPSPLYYTIPYRSLVPLGSKNLLVAGRLIDADRGAYGAVRVMVACNQTGEAAGTAAVLSLRENVDVKAVNPARLRAALEEA